MLVLKGAPLGSQYYGNPALRPLSDVDLAVPDRDASRASKLLVDMGWRPYWVPTADLFRFKHATEFYGPKGEEFDLHWRSLLEFADPRADDEFRSHAVPFEFLERHVRIPDATRMLMHTVVHGVRWNLEPPVRWIADALTILRVSGGEIKWHEIAAFAGRWQLSYRLGLGLSYLARYFDAPIPSYVLVELERRLPTLIERIEARSILCNGTELHRKTFGPLLSPLCGYARFSVGHNPVRIAAEFPSFLRFWWGLRRRREIVTYIARGMRNRFLRNIHA